MEEEQRRSRELMQRLERERQLEVHTLNNLAMLTIVIILFAPDNADNDCDADF